MFKGRFDVQNLRYSFNLAEPRFKKVTLGSLTAEEPCYGTSATAIVRTNEDQPKYIRITDFDDFGIESDHQYMTAKKYSTKHLLNEQDILFARTGGTVGKTYFYDGSIGPAIFAGYCIRFKFDNTKVLPKYVYWYTKTEEYADWVKGIQRPSGQPNINKEEYKSYEIVLPDRPVQEALSAKMDLAAKKREHMFQQADMAFVQAKERVITSIGITSEDYKPSIFSFQKLRGVLGCGIYCNAHSAYLNTLFEHLRCNKWYAGYLDEFVTINPGTDRSMLAEDTSVTFVPMTAVEEKTNHVEYESRKYSEVRTGFTIFQRGDLLWAKITPCMQNGKSFLASDMPTDIGFASTEFHVLRKKSHRIYMPYLWVILSENHILEAAQGMFSGSAGQQRVPDAFLRKFPIVLPPIEVQKELADNVFDALQRAKEMRAEAEREWQTAKAEFEKELLGE